MSALDTDVRASWLAPELGHDDHDDRPSDSCQLHRRHARLLDHHTPEENQEDVEEKSDAHGNWELGEVGSEGVPEKGHHS